MSPESNLIQLFALVFISGFCNISFVCNWSISSYNV